MRCYATSARSREQCSRDAEEGSLLCWQHEKVKERMLKVIRTRKALVSPHTRAG